MASTPSIRRSLFPRLAWASLCSLLLAAGPARAQWVAFNDHYTGAGTHANATDYNVLGTAGGAPSNGGALKNIVTGVTLPVTVAVAVTTGAVTGGATAGAPTAGTPAYNVFNGYVDFGSGTINHAVQIPASAIVSHTFSGLSPGKRYIFTATGIRGGDGTYINRWTLFALESADAYVAAHSAGCLTSGLAANAVAINTGINTSGDIMVWNNIVAGADGMFVVTATQYTGNIPSGGAANGSYGYGLTGFRLEELDVVQTPVTITNQPANVTVVEGRGASFSVGARGNPPPTYQWFKTVGGVESLVSGATNAVYSIAEVALADQGAIFRVEAYNTVTNVNFITSSSNAVLTVTADTTAPTLLATSASYPNLVNLMFSEPVTLLSSTNKANYVITSSQGSLGVLGVALAGGNSNVVLTTSNHALGVTYTLRISGIRDRSAVGNAIEANTETQFVSVAYVPADVGLTGYTGQVVNVPGGFDVITAGTDIGGGLDQMTFNYQQRTGDFDVMVRVAGMTLSDVWAKAGLMARETLTVGSPFAASLTTPSVGGCFMMYRASVNGAAVTLGSYPVMHPYTWLRLQRVGSTFNSFAGFNGQSWNLLGTFNITMAANLYVGMAATSRDVSRPIKVSFRDAGNVVAPVTSFVPLPIEPLGPSSRKSCLAITEIMYDPGQGGYSNSTEFIEIFNSNPWREDVSGYRVAGDVDFTFPVGTWIPGGGFAVVARNPEVLRQTYGLTNVFGPWENAGLNGLPDGGGTVRLRSQIDAVLLEVKYQNKLPWPVGAAGAGHSLALTRPSYGEKDPRAWSASDTRGGTPGSGDGLSGGALRNVRINEFLAYSGTNHLDYVELYNYSTSPVDVSGVVVTDDPRTNKFVIPSPTILPARGFLVFDQNALGFRLDAGGERLFLRSPDGQRMLDAITFEPQTQGRASGRFPDGGPEIYPLASQTPGNPNAAIFIDDIVINEVMYRPANGLDDDEFVELYNRGSNTVDLGGWRFVAGIDYVIPVGTLLPPDGYLVVARNRDRLLTNYSGALNAGNTLGNFSGTLASGGERVALARPEWDMEVSPDNGVQSNEVFVVVDEVTYGPGSWWGKWANEGGSSLELVDPRANHRLAGNWGESDESQKSPWTTIQYTGPMDLGSTPATTLEVYLNGEGEALLDDVEVIYNSVNIQPNGDFEAGLTGWFPRGNHVRSDVESGKGVGGGQCLHIRASGRGDYGANRIITALSTIPTTSITIRAKVRYLKGFPEIVLRLHGNWAEATGPMFDFASPPAFGTPGLRNSRAVQNAAPAIAEVKHTPVVPAANQEVLVTARVEDPDGVGQVRLSYRPDASATYAIANMVDDGSNGDAVANDGIYSGKIPGQTSGTLIAFLVSATDGAPLAATNQFPYGASLLGGECLVRFGDITPLGAFFPYRLWLTTTAVNNWINRPVLSNDPIEGTFIYGNWRAIYNCGSRYAGSPYHQGFNGPVGNNCHYSIEMPGDDQVLGTTGFNKIHGPGNGAFDDPTLQREQAAYWTARQLDLPWLNRRYVAMFVNGTRRGTLMEDMQTPNNDVLEQYFPDDADGNLYKLQPYFEMNDAATGSMNFTNFSWCTLNRYTSSTGHKLARYRVNYLTRAANGTANDYSSVYSLVEAANTFNQSANNYAGFRAAIESQVNVENWIRTFAVEHACGNWDSFGNRNAQNMYGYKPRNGKWHLFIFDFNIVLNYPGVGGAVSDAPGAVLTQVNAADPVMPYFYHNGLVPEYRRAFWRAIKEVCNGPFQSANFSPMLDAKYAAFQASGVSPLNTDAVKSFMTTAKDTMLAAMVAEDAQRLAILGTNYLTVGSSNVVVINGEAPVEIKHITVNGVTYPVSWVTARQFRLDLPVSAATNLIEIGGLDIYNRQVTNAGFTATAVYTGKVVDPHGAVVINEIMYNPQTPGASYVELYNSSTNFTFDLAGWRINGIDYTFPAGAILAPRGYLVVAANRDAFQAAYPGVSLTDVFPGSLQNNGETLALYRPGLNGEELVSQVRYDNTVPWPQAADGTGAALQLIDSRQDTTRVINWSDGSGWRFVSFTANVTGPTLKKKLLVYPDVAGEVFIDELSLVQGSVPAVGTNLIPDGNFEGSALFTNGGGAWIAQSTFGTQSRIDTAMPHSGQSSMRLVFTNSGSTVNNLGVEAPISNIVHTLSFWYLPSSNINNLTFRLTTLFQTKVDVRPNYATPGAANSVAQSNPAYPAVWLNEVAPEPLTGVLDNLGESEPWIELYNASTNSLDLGGMFLTDDYTALSKWMIPTGTVLSAGQHLVVWADGETNETAAGNLHTGFRVGGTNGTLALVVKLNNDLRILDYLNWANVWGGRTFGKAPDGQALNTRRFDYPTPGQTNNSALRPSVVRINEWMSDNKSLVADPGNSAFEDWFELYNPDAEPVDLAGWFLSDSAANWNQFEVPVGFVVPPHGYLVVWADGLTQLNTNRGDLHVNFRLSRSGESLVVHNPDARLADLVVFGAQSPNGVNGRYPDGGAAQVALLSPTPGAANLSAGSTNQNTAPILAPLGIHRLVLGQSLSLTAQAVDADLPVQTLTFNRVSGPVGLVVVPATGLITWTPGAGDVGTNHALVSVSDSGTPPLSVTNELLLVVGLPPRFDGGRVAISGNQVHLSIRAVPGKSYRIHYRDTLHGTWLPLGSDRVASGDSLEVDDTLSTNRFYRVLVVD